MNHFGAGVGSGRSGTGQPEPGPQVGLCQKVVEAWFGLCKKVVGAWFEHRAFIGEDVWVGDGDVK